MKQFHHLGVEKKDLATIYDKKPLTQQDSKKIKKYYKDDQRNLQDYYNGKELKDSFEKISNLFRDMQKNYGDQIYPIETRKQIDEFFSKKWPSLTRNFADDKKPRLNNAIDSILAEQNSEIRTSLEKLREAPDLDKKVKDSLDNLLNTPPELKFQNEIGDFIKKRKKIIFLMSIYNNRGIIFS